MPVKRKSTPRAGVKAKVKSAAPAAISTGEQARAILASLKRLGTKRVRDDMKKRYGIVGPTAEAAFGVSMANLKLVAKQAGTSHELAAALWATGNYEARMVASMVDDSALVTSKQMDDWCRGFDNWAICDTVCFKLLDVVEPKLALGKIRLWAKGAIAIGGGEDEFVVRGAFALLACVSLHNERVSEEQLLSTLPLAERAGTDERNFVKKGVSWALRGVGRRSAALREATLSLARRMAESSAAPARWIGKDVLKDLERL
ncbi:MAG: DNA alkylation repair protein [Planctomycetota bacterium]